jgi:large subunit ribosomal protein L29
LIVKIDKVRELGVEELQHKVRDLQEEIFHARIQKETGQLDQLGKVRSLRKDLARVKTVLSQLEPDKTNAKMKR